MCIRDRYIPLRDFSPNVLVDPEVRRKERRICIVWGNVVVLVRARKRLNSAVTVFVTQD